MASLVTGIRLSGYGVAYFFAAGAFMSFWPVWLRDRGISDAEIGTLFMSRQLVGIGAMLTIGWIAHRIGNVRGVILVLAGSATILLTGYQFATTFFAILTVTLVWGGVWAPTLALYDGILVNETRARGIDYGNLKIQTRLNGNVMQSDSTSHLVHDCPKVVSFISQAVTLFPGDLIFTGTPGKTSPMKVGDTVEIEIEGIGVLRNKIAQG